jgi:hypothetical protein
MSRAVAGVTALTALLHFPAVHSVSAQRPTLPVSTHSLKKAMSSGSIENRKQLRKEVCLTAHFEGTAAEVRISDLSEGGCYVDSIAEVLVGERVHLNILHDGEWVKFSGIVAHHFPRLGFGVRFVNLNKNQLQQVISLISLQNPDPVESVGTFEYSETLLSLKQIDLMSQVVM